MNTNNSEVARLQQEIADEYRAGKLMMEGPAQGAVQHQFITARMERMGELWFKLREVASENEACQFLMGM